MKSNQIGFGIVGCGSVAIRRFIPALARTTCARLVALTSRDSAKRDRLSTLYGCKGFSSLENMLEDDEIDAIYISTPVGLHVESILCAARRGKHVLCEKSLSPDLAGTEIAVRVCAEHDVGLLEGFAYQYHRQLELAREKLRDGAIGTAMVIDARFGFPPIESKHRYDPGLGGGALLDAGAYTVHISRTIFAKEPHSICASSFFGDHEVDIHGSVLLGFGKGKSALLAYGFNNSYRNECSIWGTEGVISMTRVFSTPAEFSPEMQITTQDNEERILVEPCDQFQRQIEVFCQGLDKLRERESWRQDIVSQARVLDKIRACGTNGEG